MRRRDVFRRCQLTTKLPSLKCPDVLPPDSSPACAATAAAASMTTPGLAGIVAVARRWSRRCICRRWLGAWCYRGWSQSRGCIPRPSTPATPSTAASSPRGGWPRCLVVVRLLGICLGAASLGPLSVAMAPGRAVRRWGLRRGCDLSRHGGRGGGKLLLERVAEGSRWEM